MAQEAKFYLLNYKSRKQEGLENHIEYLIKLVDADGVEVRYSITDYYNSKNEITDTRIWPLTNNVELLKLIENDSRLGIKGSMDFGEGIEAIYQAESNRSR
jgi:predicted porin